MLDPGKSDHPLAAVGVVAQTPSNVAANLYLHTGLAEVDIAVAVKLKAHHVLHDPDEAAPHGGPESTPLEGDTTPWPVGHHPRVGSNRLARSLTAAFAHLAVSLILLTVGRA
jgi:hypothetical protein